MCAWRKARPTRKRFLVSRRNHPAPKSIASLPWRYCNVSRKIGLPVTLKMRHDAHYVETLASYSGASIGRMIPIDKVRPNPDQPRKTIGDLRELTDSIREKGVLEPLLVRFVPREDTYYIISGERRYHASRAAGLHEVPCIEKIADDAETLELALIENLAAQGSDRFRRSRRPVAPRRAFRLHARRHRPQNRQGALVGHRDAVAARDSGSGSRSVHREGHRLEVAAAAGRPPAERKEDARNGASASPRAAFRATKPAAHARKKTCRPASAAFPVRFSAGRQFFPPADSCSARAR